MKQTVLGLKSEGQKVNLEFDHEVKVIVNTVERMLPEIKEKILSNLINLEKTGLVTNKSIDSN